MATSAATPLRLARAAAQVRTGLWVGVGLGALAGLSVLLRVGVLDAGLWVDEGLSFGIADRPLGDIPGVLRQDGSPPLYYVLLHGWIALTGARSEAALHALSLGIAVLTVPVAYALMRALVSRRAGWIAAVLFATNPFLTQYAQEARMYALVVLLSLTTCATFAGAFALRPSRRWTLAFALSMSTLLYTHNWSLFLGAGLAAGFGVLLALAADRRALLREGLIAAGVIAVAYAPWLPTLLFQAAHTGAPWARVPDLELLVEAPTKLLGTTGAWLLLITGGAGLATIVRRPLRGSPAPGRAALALAVAGVLCILIPWVMSQVAPAYATRYLAVAVGPLLVLATIGLARAGRLGLVAVSVVALIWAFTPPPTVKSNVREIAAAVAPGLAPGDLVISTQPEQVPVLNYYLAPEVGGLRWATITGELEELGVTDWRDGEQRLDETSVVRDLDPLLAGVRPGQRVALILPDFSIISRWKAPWTRLVRLRSRAWEDRLRTDPRFRVIAVEPTVSFRRAHELRAEIYVRQPLDSPAVSRAASG